ncbi:hypothetical protein GBA65_15980 [Rubrobacter marinus]|uniref:Twin-arginine translocation signal domain-containing protein n=1 Tax=Rubrobacter marinus TaxID=2653852 RepID=A0A6G8PZY5_9ACTN|nr:hypothetical protein [Rubrobacter marinus]QIN79781.1 hypothetical protein GBA65_15980 [Rubrobacter marinus]
MARPRNDEVLSRRAFLKLGLAGLSATALLFLSGCLGRSRRRRRTTRTKTSRVRRHKKRR